MSKSDIKVPDIGGSTDVEVIELCVAPGDTIAVDDVLIVLESDKATMEIPASEAGAVLEMKLAVGDKVSEGDLILIIESAEPREVHHFALLFGFGASAVNPYIVNEIVGEMRPTTNASIHPFKLVRVR